MLCVQLTGGLGNQMFQYAAGRALAIKHDTDIYIDYCDLSKKSKFTTPRSLELGIFTHAGKAALESPPNFLKLHRILGPILNLICGDRKVIFERRGDINISFPFAENNYYLVGYWQSPLYFSGIENTLLKDFNFRLPLSSTSLRVLSHIESSNSVSLHVRRGDYMANKRARKFHGTLPLDYYEYAIKIILERVAAPILFIFSDDPSWCRDNLQFKNCKVHYVDHNHNGDAWQDMYLMSHCKSSVIANSTFSWWGAWLGDQRGNNSNRTVIAPLNWFAGNQPTNFEFYPRNWILI